MNTHRWKIAAGVLALLALALYVDRNRVKTPIYRGHSTFGHVEVFKHCGVDELWNVQNVPYTRYPEIKQAGAVASMLVNYDDIFGTTIYIEWRGELTGHLGDQRRRFTVHDVIEARAPEDDDCA